MLAAAKKRRGATAIRNGDPRFRLDLRSLPCQAALVLAL